MLLGNADIKVPVGKTLVKLHHARAFAHGGRDAYQANVALGHIAQPLPEYLRKRGFGRHGGRLQAHGRVEFARAVVGDGVCLGRRIAMPFARYHMQELRPFEVADIFQCGDQHIQIVPVNRADVVEAELFKQRSRQHHAFGLLFQPLGKFQQGRHAFEYAFAHIARLGVKLPTHQMRQIAVERPYRRADAHVVVVEDDEQAQVLLDAGVVQGFKRHAGRHGAVTNYGDVVLLFAHLASRNGHAQGGRDAGGRVCGAKSIVFAFVAARKAAQTV